MKKIYLLRHAKAEKEAKSDLKRDLNLKGKEDIKKLCLKLKTYNIAFDLIASSPATRASKTAKKVAEFLSYAEDKIHFEQSIYEANASELFSYVKALDDELGSILLVGHNPSLCELAELLSDICINSFPTSSMLALEFDVTSFKDIKEHSGKILFFECVKNIN